MFSSSGRHVRPSPHSRAQKRSSAPLSSITSQGQDSDATEPVSDHRKKLVMNAKKKKKKTNVTVPLVGDQRAVVELERAWKEVRLQRNTILRLCSDGGSRSNTPLASPRRPILKAPAEPVKQQQQASPPSIASPLSSSEVTKRLLPVFRRQQQQRQQQEKQEEAEDKPTLLPARQFDFAEIRSIWVRRQTGSKIERPSSPASSSPSALTKQKEEGREGEQVDKAKQKEDATARSSYVKGVRVAANFKFSGEKRQFLAEAKQGGKEQEEEKQDAGLQLSAYFVPASPPVRSRRSCKSPFQHKEEGTEKEEQQEDGADELTKQTQSAPDLWMFRGGRTSLHSAVRDRNVQKLRSLLSAHPQHVSKQEEKGWSALHIACANAQLDIIRLLLQQPLHNDSENEENQKKEKQKTDEDDDDSTNNIRADLLSVTNEEQATALHYFAGSVPTDKALGHSWWSLYESLLRTMVRMMNGGEGDDQQRFLDKNGETPLHWAARSGVVRAVRALLVVAQADPNGRNREGETCLHIAARKGDREMVRLLLAYGIDASLQNQKTQTAKHVALQEGRLGIYEMLGGGGDEESGLKVKVTEENVRRCQRIVRRWLNHRTSLLAIASKYGQHNEASFGRKRYRALHEILESQERYTGYLRILVDCFVKPFQQEAQKEGGAVTKEEVQTIFSNIQSILILSESMQSTLAERLNSRYSHDKPIGRYFSQMAPALKLYSTFICNFDEASKTLRIVKQRPQAQTLIKQCESMIQGANQALESYLIMPVQQVPKYRLLLEEVIRYTPSEHIDYDSISAALQDIKEVLELLNSISLDVEAKRKIKECEKKIVFDERQLRTWQKGAFEERRYIGEGTWMPVKIKEDLELLPLEKLSSRLNKTSVYAFIFNDVIVITTGNKASSKYIARHVLRLEKIELDLFTIEHIGGEKTVSLRLLQRRKMHKFILGTTEEENLAMKDLIERLFNWQSMPTVEALTVEGYQALIAVETEMAETQGTGSPILEQTTAKEGHD